MNGTVTIPVLSEKVPVPSGGPATYRVRPLFIGLGVHGSEVDAMHSPREDRALAALGRELRKLLNEAASGMRHDLLARWSFCPPVDVRRPSLTIMLRKRSLRGDFLLVTFEMFGRRVVVAPQWPEVSFDLGRGEDLATRATEVLQDHFRRIEKNGGELPGEDELRGGSARVTTIDIDVRARQRFEDKSRSHFALLTGGGKMSGAAELERTGRCLNRLFPGDLQRAILRDDEVSALDRHFGGPRPGAAPLVLAGPPQVGKTAVIHEFLFRWLDRPGKTPEVWLLSPQRLISGMSFVGQWEERVHAILKEAARRNHILFFDDLPGLFEAGKSRDSELTVGHLLKAHLEDGTVRVLGEITPEAWRKLREIDRGFADLFRVVRVREPDEAGTLRILTRAMQSLEFDQHVEFDVDVLPEIVHLQRRYARRRAFPGKGVAMLRQLARRAGKRPVGVRDVREFFRQKTGIANQFLHPGAGFDAAAARAWFAARIKGQPDVVQALTDVALTCAQQLNDPGRPMASLLFLGPTGVGKTESAKALAGYFFGSAERMLRFDMNEFVGGDAVARLIGTRARPHGLLTGVIRRRPYAVVLLDEIEKAHPAVLDLLLQLLGDGRLTDARGHTADFGNCVIILTSNLGARAARHQLGFGSGARTEGDAYREAAEVFFRPELFNRLDQVVPFRELGRDDIASLVDLLARKALARQGVEGRRLKLTVDASVNDALVDLGFQPEYGARALRRAVEQHLVEPLAVQLGALSPNEPSAVHLTLGADGGLEFRSSRFVAAARAPHRLRTVSLARADDVLDAAHDCMLRVGRELDAWFGDDGGVIDPSDPGRVAYFNLREEMEFLRRLRERFAGHVASLRKQPAGQRRAPGGHGRRLRAHLEVTIDDGKLLDAFFAAGDSGRFLAGLAEEARVVDATTHLAGELLVRANRLSFLASPRFRSPDRILVRMTDSSPDRHAAIPSGTDGTGESRMYHEYVRRYLQFLTQAPNLEGRIVQRDGRGEPIQSRAPGKEGPDLEFMSFDTALIYGEGPALRHWLASEEGVQLFTSGRGVLDFCALEVFLLSDGESPEDAFDRVSGTEPFRPGPEMRVVRLHHESGHVCDLPTGTITANFSLPLWKLLMPLAPVAGEMADFFEASPADGNSSLR